MKPVLLDLFCGAGGAGYGYWLAGFDVVGIDHRPQPHYPCNFILGDALAYLDGYGHEYAAVHASPPCERWAEGSEWHGRERYPDYIEPLRPLLEKAGRPYVIENVPRAPLRADVQLCGTGFRLGVEGYELRRHRIFEVSFPLVASPPPCAHRLPAVPVFGHNPNGDFYDRNGGGLGAHWRRIAMGCPWMQRDELAEAIPPAYTEWIGRQLLEHINARKEAASWATP